MTPRAPGRPSRARLPHPHDDSGMMSFALLAVLVGVLLGGLMLPMIITQTRSTRFDITRVHALHAAQAGLDVALGRIRASTSEDGDGKALGSGARLPCYSEADPLTGSVGNPEDAGPEDPSYSVHVVYWVSDPSAGGDPMVCAPEYGTFDQATRSVTPRYAVLTSTGTDGAVSGGSRGRTLTSTYTFHTDDTNVSGGVIRLFPESGVAARWCLDAGADPAPGTQLEIQECSTSAPPKAQQAFAYRSDLSLQLVSSIGDTFPRGLCIDTLDGSHDPDGEQVVLRECDGDLATCSDSRRCSSWRQQWSINDFAHLEGARSDQSGTDNRCLEAPAAEADTKIILDRCTGDTNDPRQSWIPSPSAGAGMAGPANQQLVNFLQFARCLDVPNADPDRDFLLVYACKQNPNPDNVTWNQRFTPSVPLADTPTSALVQTTKDGTTYCLTSQGTDGYHVRLASCPPGPADADPSTWTFFRTQDGNGVGLPYAQKFTIVDSSGRCLGLDREWDPDGGYTTATVNRCNGSRGQKWNAEASLDAPTISNTRETSPRIR